MKPYQRMPVGADREAGHGPGHRAQVPRQRADVGEDRRGIAFAGLIDDQPGGAELLERQVDLELFDLWGFDASSSWNCWGPEWVC